MRVSPLFSTITTRLSIAPPTIAHFRWGWDSNPCVPLMFHYLLQTYSQNILMFSLRPTKPLDSLSGFNTYAIRPMRFCRKPMLSKNNTVINIGYHISFRWEIRSGYICINNVLQGPIESPAHFVVGLTLSPRLWVAMLLISTLHPSLACTASVQCGPPSSIFSTIIGHLRDRIIVDTNKAQTWLHGTHIHWWDSGHTGQGNLPEEDQSLSGFQGRTTPTPRQVAHPKPNST
jgi:hypothetical protein